MKKLIITLAVLVLLPILVPTMSGGIAFAQHIGTGISDHTIVTKSDGTVYTWGWNYYGQLGNGNNTDSNVPVAVSTSGTPMAGKIITQVAAGYYHSIALASDGTVYTWGYNWYGQLGNGTWGGSNVPVAVVDTGVLYGKTITQVAAGNDHSIALASDGTVYTWGDNWVGQLGNGTSGWGIYSNVPVTVDKSGVLSGKIITQVAAGSSHSIASASDGTVYTWGWNGEGELGNGTTGTNSNVPVAVSTSGVLSGKTITQVAAGVWHSIALASDGTVYTWGLNEYGQLGNGDNINYNVPVAVSTDGVLFDKKITQVAAGLHHTIALASDGTVYTWGWNGYGSLGNGTTTDSKVPVEVDTSGVLSGKTIIQVAAGIWHSIALASDGTVYTWGYNEYGQLGNGTSGLGTYSNVPVAVDQSLMGLLPVEDNLADQLPGKFELSQNYPNPFNPNTVISYQLPALSQVTLKVYDLLGREVAILVNEVKPAGEYEVEFNGKGLSSGMYFYELRAGNFVQVKKMILLK